MNEPTNVTLGSRLKSFITSPKTVTILGLFTLGGYGYKTGNWDIAAGLMSAAFALYKIFDYRRNIALIAELENFAPKETNNKKEYDPEKLIRP